MSITAICDQLESQGVTDYVCFPSTGLPAFRATGCFESSEEQCAAAFSLIHHGSSLLIGEEKLKRVTAVYESFTFVASVVFADEQNYGIVVRR